MSLLGRLLGRGDEDRITGDSWDLPWMSAAQLGGLNEITSFNLSAVWACETLIADAIATMPAGTYRKEGDQRVPTEAPLWMAQPNVDANRVDYETARLLSLLGWGNAYSLIMRRGGATDGPVTERWLIDPWRVQVHRAAGTSASYLVDGLPVPRENIQHVSGYRLPGAVVGMSVVEQARRSFTLSTNAEKFSDAFLANGASPSGVLEIPQMPAESSKEVVDRLREQFASRYSGSANAGKPMVVTGGTQWKQISVNPVDAELLSQRKFQTTEIARWFRVPPHMIGDVEKSTSWGTGIEQQYVGFVRFTLMPWIVRLEQADTALLAPGPNFVSFNVNALLRADLKTRFESYQIARLNGWMSANDVRAYEDLAPIPNGDRYLEPLNYTEAGVENAAPTQETPDGPQ